MATCGSCEHFIGAGDWDLCCDIKHEGYPCGFLCYEYTDACEYYEFAHNCRTCEIPHNRWTGCPKIDGKIPYPNFSCNGWECSDKYKTYLENIKYQKPNFTKHTSDNYPN